MLQDEEKGKQGEIRKNRFCIGPSFKPLKINYRNTLKNSAAILSLTASLIFATGAWTASETIKNSFFVEGAYFKTEVVPLFSNGHGMAFIFCFRKTQRIIWDIVERKRLKKRNYSKVFEARRIVFQASNLWYALKVPVSFDQKKPVRLASKQVQSKWNQEQWPIFFVVGILVVTSLLFYTYKLRLRSREREQNLLLEISKMKEEKSRLHREIAISTANLATNSGLLNHIKDTLQRVNQRQKTPEETIRLLKNTEKVILDSLYSNKVWDDFFVQFEAVNPFFTKKLVQEFGLSPGELKICCFLRMNVSYKEIAVLLNVSHSSIKQSAYRIKKKLRLPKEQSVFSFLHAL